MAMLAEEFAKTLVGMDLEKARKRAEEHGLKLRVLREDGQHFMGTCDYWPNRVSVSVDDGKVTSIMSVG